MVYYMPGTEDMLLKSIIAIYTHYPPLAKTNKSFRKFRKLVSLQIYRLENEVNWMLISLRKCD